MSCHCDAVLTVEPVTAGMRARHGLSPDAVLALVETCEHQVFVVSTDDQCAQGITAAARAWAEATGAAFREAA